MRVTRTLKNEIEPREATLREFLATANVCSSGNITHMPDGTIWIRFTGKDGADDWSFWLESGGFISWLQVTGAKLYRCTFSPKKSSSVGVAWPTPDIERWNRAGNGVWEYSLLPAQEMV